MRGQLRGCIVQGPHRQVDPRRNDAAFKAAIRADQIKGRRCAAIDHDLCALIKLVRADGSNQAVRPDLFRPADADGNAKA